MKIGVLSDTHLRECTAELSELSCGPFAAVDMVLHSGDITELAVLEGLKAKEIYAVYGNMDSPTVRQALPYKRILQIGRFRIGLIHGWGAPKGIEDRIVQEFEGADCIVFGHTHTPSQIQKGGILFFNPGSFGRGWARSKRSVGILDVTDQINGEIIWL